MYTRAAPLDPRNMKVRSEELQEEDLEDDSSTVLEPNEKLNLAKDSYSGFIFSCIMFSDHATVEKNGFVAELVQLCLSTLIHICSCGIQIFLIFMLYVYADERAEDPYEKNLDQVIATLKDATANMTELSTTSDVEASAWSLCKKDHSVPYTAVIILLLWGFKVAPEVMAALWNAYVVFMMPAAEAGDTMITRIGDFNDPDKFRIDKIHSHQRIIFIVCVDLPRISISCLLYLVGAKFLVFCPSVGVLIMKAISLAFVLTLDELLFSGMASLKQQERIAKAALHYHQASMPIHWHLWGSTVTKVGIILMCTLMITEVWYADLQAFRRACLNYKVALIFPKCEHCGTHFLGRLLET
eukprot:gnl/TRDRNA2_/TRDRNA2_176613_c0_seq2.p1 gnl/TRDRNA2_/TRDRNA2_176613_c0~~gnl/TRDRNA2_/TRDRNA2_176613_c0_seq2.p1  ORF type:complete len:355 (+),score=58.98 gnl/TRDRNA2_/TRDRNA2_176613_c0_seq2:99-1163(+)